MSSKKDLKHVKIATKNNETSQQEHHNEILSIISKISQDDFGNLDCGQIKSKKNGKKMASSGLLSRAINLQVFRFFQVFSGFLKNRQVFRFFQVFVYLGHTQVKIHKNRTHMQSNIIFFCGMNFQ